MKIKNKKVKGVQTNSQARGSTISADDKTESPSMKKGIDFRLEAKELEGQDKAVVYLYGDIEDDQPVDFWTGEPEIGDFIYPEKVRDIVDSIEADEIELHINSYGGSVFASVAIYNYLNGLDKKIITVNDGLCASGASLIFMVGNKRIMPKNTVLMMHRASSFGWGNCAELRKLADTLEKLDNSTVLETYKAKFKGTDEKLLNLIDAETWITAQEALDYGLCDEVVELEEEEEEKEIEKVPDKAEITNGINLMRNFANLKLK